MEKITDSVILGIFTLIISKYKPNKVVIHANI